MKSVFESAAFIEIPKVSDSACSSGSMFVQVINTFSPSKTTHKRKFLILLFRKQSATDFSHEGKSLQLQMPKLRSDGKRNQLDDECYSEMSY